jgi:predicted 3-demethylubiquinone-9 3-methyltransferase (glyoxalase superfamily)
MKISTCLWFDTQAEEAARFYVSLFAHARVTDLSRYGPGQRMPAGLALVVNLEIEGARFMLLNGGPIFPQSEAASICVSCDTQAEIDRLWPALTAEGGKESMCGWLKDRFGVSWQITPAILGPLMSGDPARAARVMAAFMQMRKFDIAALHAAAQG